MTKKELETNAARLVKEYGADDLTAMSAAQNADKLCLSAGINPDNLDNAQQWLDWFSSSLGSLTD